MKNFPAVCKYLAIILIALNSFSWSNFAVSAEIVAGLTFDSHTARQRWKHNNQNLDNRSFSCPNLIEPIIIFESSSIYKDTPCRCIIDPQKKAIYDNEIAILRNYSKTLVKLADLYSKTPRENPEIAQCAQRHITHWSETGAMTGDHLSHVGYQKAGEILGVVAQTFNKIKHAEGIELPTSGTATYEWMRQLSDSVLYFYDNLAGPNTRNNNHRYWDSFYLGSAAVVMNDHDLFNWAQQGLTIGLEQIQADGTLPLEMARGSKAYRYHLYAVAPLVGLSQLMLRNQGSMSPSYSPYQYNQGALANLIDLLLNDDTTIFTDKSAFNCSRSAWMEIYAHNVQYNNQAFYNRLKQQRQQCNSRLYSTNLGGDISYYYGLKLD
ncbi:MAG: alginate lyase family protein [Gammaproteobacteria bacterium]|nr:alginate lyase family protein [Gammaproteobacteria bacterium]